MLAATPGRRGQISEIIPRRSALFPRAGRRRPLARQRAWPQRAAGHCGCGSRLGRSREVPSDKVGGRIAWASTPDRSAGLTERHRFMWVAQHEWQGPAPIAARPVLSCCFRTSAAGGLGAERTRPRRMLSRPRRVCRAAELDGWFREGAAALDAFVGSRSCARAT
jgi:hypothetical protein